MTLETIGRAALLIDIVAVGALLILTWQALREQSTDIGKVGGVLAIAALSFVLYVVGRAFLGV